MCIITRKTDNVVVSISLIPGVDFSEGELSNFNVFFPVTGQLPDIGSYYYIEELLLNR